MVFFEIEQLPKKAMIAAAENIFFIDCLLSILSKTNVEEIVTFLFRILKIAFWFFVKFNSIKIHIIPVFLQNMEHTKRHQLTDWLPTTNKEVKIRGWDELDVILFSGDAYVDHPSFGPAVIGRILESYGLRVAIVPQPSVNDNLQDFEKLGKPRLFFGATGGCMDPMVSNYTASKKRRDKDAYTPNGDKGFRPDYATSVYSRILKEKFPDVPVLIGGIEAS